MKNQKGLIARETGILLQEATVTAMERLHVGAQWRQVILEEGVKLVTLAGYDNSKISSFTGKQRDVLVLECLNCMTKYFMAGCGGCTASPLLYLDRRALDDGIFEYEVICFSCYARTKSSWDCPSCRSVNPYHLTVGGLAGSRRGHQRNRSPVQ
jgi:hypothetical protein